MNDHILLSYVLNGKGGGTPLDSAQDTLQTGDNPVWIHLGANHPQTRTWLDQQQPQIDPLVIDALLAEETRPRQMVTNESVMLILRGVNLNQDAIPEDMVSIRIWADHNRVISLRKRRLVAVMDLEEKLRAGAGPKDIGQLLSMITSLLFNRMEPILSKLNDDTDDIEEQILEHPDIKLRSSIIDIRKKAIIFRRYMAPQKDAIGMLIHSELFWLHTSHKRHLQESLNQITRYVEDLEAVRERAQIVTDELVNIMADKLNRNMYVLSVIAAIFLPLGFLTGLLGINVGGIPGADYGGSFYIFCLILIAVVMAQIAVFRKMRWF